MSFISHFWLEWCFTMCVLRFDFWLKHFLQKLHENGFSPVWIKLCFFMSLAFGVVLEQNGQPYFFGPSFMGLCPSRFESFSAFDLPSSFNEFLVKGFCFLVFRIKFCFFKLMLDYLETLTDSWNSLKKKTRNCSKSIPENWNSNIKSSHKELEFWCAFELKCARRIVLCQKAFLQIWQILMVFHQCQIS